MQYHMDGLEICKNAGLILYQVNAETWNAGRDVIRRRYPKSVYPGWLSLIDRIWPLFILSVLVENPINRKQK
jgi:hypothetical protein